MSRVSLNKSQYGSRRVRKISSVRFVWSAQERFTMSTTGLLVPRFFSIKSNPTFLPPSFFFSPVLLTPFRDWSMAMISSSARMYPETPVIT